jgi:hypothetical protein
MAAVSQVTNLGELLDYVADELDRTDLDTVIQAWPSLVEAELHRKIVDGEPFRHWRMILIDSLDIEEDNPLVALPNATDDSGDWLETVSVRWGTYNAVYNSPDLISIQKRTFEESGEPSLDEIDPRYTYRGANFELWPTPSEDGTLSVEYYAKIPAMVGEGTTNWLLTHAPDVYIYGCLKQSAPYLRDDERIVVWDRLFEDAVGSLQMEGKQARQSGSRMTRPAPVAF